MNFKKVEAVSAYNIYDDLILIIRNRNLMNVKKMLTKRYRQIKILNTSYSAFYVKMYF
jgi:hypothetical protein